MTEQPTVFIVQDIAPDWRTGEPRRDFTPAEEYGTLKFLLPYTAKFHTGEELLDLLVKAGIDEYQTGDALLLSGHPAAIGVATARVLSSGERGRLLVGESKIRSYVPIELTYDRMFEDT